jgi:hypothetical protein
MTVCAALQVKLQDDDCHNSVLMTVCAALQVKLQDDDARCGSSGAAATSDLLVPTCNKPHL